MRRYGSLQVALSSAAGRRPYGRPALADDFQTSLRRRLHEAGGLALIAGVGVAVFALATWSVNDPSLSYATSAPVRNMLGVTGAIAADLAMQLFGMATIAILLPPAFWGWRFFTHRTFDRLRWRLAAWV
ncbi:MAG: DNA translocase FtsK 4TM domain-containing protein, partial [Bradyrhizobiaceae bacterium]|nr:DNA translocase FtsK 4TM domain-containing protein [Bradyrhizobiaceae bacterium]